MSGIRIVTGLEPTPEDADIDTDECFAYDLFLACVTGLVARGIQVDDVYVMAKGYAQALYDEAAADKDFHEVMDQTWPTKDS